MSKLFVNTIAPNSGDTVTLSGSLVTTGKLTIGDASTDTVAFEAEISSSLIPDVGATYALGTMANSWGSLHVHGLGHIHTASINLISSSLIPDGDDVYDLGSSTKQWKDLYIDGISYLDYIEGSNATFNVLNISSSTTTTASIDRLNLGNTLSRISGSLLPHINNVSDLGSSELQFKNLFLDGTASMDGADIQGLGLIHTASIGEVTSSLIPSVNDAVDLGSDGVRWKDLYLGGSASVGYLDLTNASISGSLIPNADNKNDLGGVGQEFRDLYIDRTAYIDTIDTPIIISPTITGTGSIDAKHITATHITASSLIVSGVNFNSSVLASADAAHLGSADGFNKFSVQGQLQAAVADGATSAEFTVGNTGIALGDIIVGTAHGALMGGLSQSNMIITTRTANSMSFVFNNESGLVAVDDSAFTASFAIIK